MNHDVPNSEVPTLIAAAPARTLPEHTATRIRELFDRTFYLAANPDVVAAGLEPLAHFLEHGLMEGRSPHPLFDPTFYALHAPHLAADEPAFLHYLREGGSSGLDPHPLFETAHYVAQTEARSLFGELPLLHFIRIGTLLRLSPNPLFDAAYYRRRNGLGDSFPRHPLLHYVEGGWREGCRTHPLFDTGYYLTLRPDVAQAGIEPLGHYLHYGFHETHSTHELFDAALYRAAFADRPAERAAIDQRGAILHYALAAGSAAERPPVQRPPVHGLFDAEAYVRRFPRNVSGSDAGFADPFLHFLEVGLAAQHDPHPLFDCSFYLNRYPDVAAARVPAFLHFVRHGALEGRDPNPCFDAEAYLARYPQAASAELGAISHYLAGGSPAPASRHFDPAYYRDVLRLRGEISPDDLARDPMSHYLATGREMGVPGRARPLAELGWQPVAPSREGGKPVLLILRDAGAEPASRDALRAVQQLAADPDLACWVALLQEGPLLDAFREEAPVVCLDGDIAAAELLHGFAREMPHGTVVIKTLSSPGIIELALRLDLHLLAWLHELPVVIDSTPNEATSIRLLADSEARIITVSNAAQSALCSRYGLAPERVMVLASGTEMSGLDQTTLADDPAAPGTGDSRTGPGGPLAANPDRARQEGARVAARARSAKARAGLGMPPDALLVLGGGRTDFLHGCDLFIKVAQQVVRRGVRGHQAHNALAQAYFVWVGRETDALFAALCRQDVQQLGLAGRFRFVEGPEAMQGLLGVADMFLMTARAEALQSDGRQAVGSGIPVVAFEGCAEAADLPQDRDSQLVGYLDVEAMAERVLQLGNRPARRKAPGASAETGVLVSGLGKPPGSGARAPARLASWSQWHAGLRQVLGGDRPRPT